MTDDEGTLIEGKRAVTASGRQVTCALVRPAGSDEIVWRYRWTGPSQKDWYCIRYGTIDWPKDTFHTLDQFFGMMMKAEHE